MVRLLLLTSLCLTTAFAVIGALLSRQWGWSEYASPDLYIIYAQGPVTLRYFIVNTDGESAGERLASGDDPIARMDCSPDGRTLAIMTEAGHLSVLTSAGLTFDRMVDRTYDVLDVANNGTVALYDWTQGGRLIRADGSEALKPPDTTLVYPGLRISSSDLALWTKTDGTQVASGSGEIRATLPDAFVPEWLASEQIFIFNSMPSAPRGTKLGYGRYVMDVSSGQIAYVKGMATFSQFSPDGTQVANAVAVDRRREVAQLVVSDARTHDAGRQLTSDPNVSSIPVCFLTFRPMTLVNP